MEWPRIPLPGWPDGNAVDAAETLARSAARGRELAALLDPDTSVPGVTTGTLRPDLAAIAVPATVDGRNIDGDDFALTAGWGITERVRRSCPAKAALLNASTPRTNAPRW